MGTIFGGSMFSAVDPIPMVQLINILDHHFVVWDKSATISFKKPANVNLFAEFTYTTDEIEAIKRQVEENKETEIVKTTRLTNEDKSILFCEVNKTIYIADKDYYKQKRATRQTNKNEL